MKSKALRVILTLLAGSALLLLLAACRPVESLEPIIETTEPSFSGERALELESAFVGRYPERASGQVGNQAAADWLQQTLIDLGYECIMDKWEVVNYSRVVPLTNVICRLDGEQEASIILLSHFDNSPFAVEGADDSASGVATAIHLAEILAAEGPWPDTIDFVFTDGNLYGGLGARRLTAIHPDPEQIKAAIVIDNLGLPQYDSLAADPQGQFSGYGPLWLQLAAEAVSQVDPESATVILPSVWEQLTQQAIPLSFEDQGPLVAAGWPAIGLYGNSDSKEAKMVWQILFSVDDRIERQSAKVIERNGRLIEGLVRRLQGIGDPPENRAPHLYFAEQDQVLGRGVILVSLIGFGLTFVIASYLSGRGTAAGYWPGLSGGWPHFLGLWAPLAISVVILALFTYIGLIDQYEVYPATFKDPAITQPRLFVIFLWLIALWELLQMGRRLTALYMADRTVPTYRQIQSLAYLVVAIGFGYIFLQNPMSLLLLLPTLSWFFMRERHGWAKLINVLLLVTGFSLVIWAVIFLGFEVIQNSLAIFWYFFIFIAIRSLSLPTAFALTAIIAAGLALVVPPVRLRHQDGSPADEAFQPPVGDESEPEGLEVVDSTADS